MESEYPLALKFGLSAISCWVHAILWLFLSVIAFPVHASHHYTDRQLDVLAARVGKIYWIVAINNQTPTFLSSPATNASSFRSNANESFEITELIGRKEKNPYYKVKFDSGKEGYIQPDLFLEEFNARISAVDPLESEKKKAAEAAEEEKERIAWIQAQPWPRGVKEAAIKRQVMPGMNGGEVKKILGNPIRVTKIKKQPNVTEEHWLYGDGSTAIFHNGVFSHIVKANQGTPEKK
jgi:uncharacterized protein YgiM (DUF1202 family)